MPVPQLSHTGAEIPAIEGPTADNGSRVCARCGAATPPGNQCAACGAFVAGNEASLRHGLRRYQTTGVLPADLKVSVDQFRDQVISDQGGLEGLSAIRAGLCRLLVDLEAGRRLNMNEVVRRGIDSRPGRAAYDRLLSTIDRWQRVAVALGVERRTRDAMSLGQYLEQRYQGAPAGPAVPGDLGQGAADDRATTGQPDSETDNVGGSADDEASHG